MEFIEKFANQLGLQRFEGNPHVIKVASAIKVKPIIIILAAFIIISLTLIATRFGRLLIESTFVFFYPAYKSFEAVKTESSVDDKKWLTYWVIFGFFYGFEQSLGFMVNLIPIWPLIRTVLFVVLMLPQYNYPHVIYVRAVQPIFEKYSGIIDPLLDNAEKGLKKFGDKAKSAAAEKIAENLVKTE